MHCSAVAAGDRQNANATRGPVDRSDGSGRVSAGSAIGLATLCLYLLSIVIRLICYPHHVAFVVVSLLSNSLLFHLKLV